MWIEWAAAVVVLLVLVARLVAYQFDRSTPRQSTSMIESARHTGEQGNRESAR